MVYAIYRSRDVKKFKVTPSMWETIERAVKSVAKRAMDLGEFIERLKPKLACASIKPKWAKTHPDDIITMKIDPDTGELMQVQEVCVLLCMILKEITSPIKSRNTAPLFRETAGLSRMIMNGGKL